MNRGLGTCQLILHLLGSSSLFPNSAAFPSGSQDEQIIPRGGISQQRIVVALPLSASIDQASADTSCIELDLSWSQVNLQPYCGLEGRKRSVISG